MKRAPKRNKKGKKIEREPNEALEKKLALNLTTWGHAAHRLKMINTWKEENKELGINIEVVSLMPGVILGPLLINRGSFGYHKWTDMYDKYQDG